MVLEIKKTAHVYDEREGLWYAEFEFSAIGGAPTRVEVRRDLCDPGRLRQKLLAHGAVLPPTDECKDYLKAVVAEDVSEKRRAASNGWRAGNNGRPSDFVSFKIVASHGGEQEILSPADHGLIAANIDIVGSLDEWKKLIEVSRFSTIMTVALCAAFAAPLLSLLRRQSFGVVFFGPSRAGKSTVQLACGSVVGYGTEEDLPTLKATEAGLLDLGLMFSDHVLLINEMGTASGRKEKIAQALYEATYSLMSGHDKQRHRSFQAGVAGKNSFRVIPIVSSEFSPDEWAERAGQARDPGETARMIAVPALLNGADTVFDTLPADVERTEAYAWIMAQYAALREGLPQHRGVAFRAYIEQLVADLDGAMKGAREAASLFEKKVMTPTMTPVQRDIVSKFALLAAGGVLAIDKGILPMTKGEVRDACETACLAAVAALPEPEARLHKQVAKLRTFLTGATIVDCERASARRLADLSGADGCVTIAGFERTYVIRGTAFKEWFGAGAAALLGWLDDEGLLVHSRSRNGHRLGRDAADLAGRDSPTVDRYQVAARPRRVRALARSAVAC